MYISAASQLTRHRCAGKLAEESLSNLVSRMSANNEDRTDLQELASQYPSILLADLSTRSCMVSGHTDTTGLASPHVIGFSSSGRIGVHTPRKQLHDPAVNASGIVGHFLRGLLCASQIVIDAGGEAG
jgi:hypothetical protein